MSDHFDWSSCLKNFHISTALFSHTEESLWTDVVSYVYSQELIVYMYTYAHVCVHTHRYSTETISTSAATIS